MEPHRPRLLAWSDALRRALANFAWLTLERVIALITAFVVGLWVARYLGPEHYGRLNYAISLVALARPLVMLGLNNISARELVRRTDRHHTILGTMFAMRLAVAVVVAPLIMVTITILRPDDDPLQRMVWVVALAVLPQSLFGIEHWFAARLESRYAVLARVVATLLIAAMRIMAIVLGAGVMTFAVLFLVQVVIEAALLLAVYMRRPSRPGRWNVEMALGRQLFADAWPMMVLSVGMIVCARIDHVMLGTRVSDEAVGLYALATFIAEMPRFVGQAMFRSVLPGAVELRENKPRLYARRLQQVHDGMLWTGVAIAFAIWLLMPWLVPWVLGDAYAPSVPVLRILCWGVALTYLGWAQRLWIIVENRQRVLAASSVIAAIVNVGLNLLWIPMYGVTGAAWAMLVTQVALILIPLAAPGTALLQRYLLLSLIAPARYITPQRGE